MRQLVLNGPTMGTRWSVTFVAPAGMETEGLARDLQAAVDRVDNQMSTWKPDSDLMRLNRAAVGIWQSVPAELMTVLKAALRIGEQSGGLFDIGVGDAVSAWGFGARGTTPDAQSIAGQLNRRRAPAHQFVELDAPNLRVRRHAPESLDLSGIAKGFGADELMRVMRGAGIDNALTSIDGELVGRGRRLDGQLWAIAVERPDYDRRDVLGVVELEDRAVATSGDYRHWVRVGDTRLSHTMDPRIGGPARSRVASTTVVNPSCMVADAWATVLLVAGENTGPALAAEHGLDALFVLRDGPEIRQFSVGRVFGGSQKMAV